MTGRCNSRWWGSDGKAAAHCHYLEGHHLVAGRERHYGDGQTWTTFDNRWRSYSPEQMRELLRVVVLRPPWAWGVAWAGKNVENRLRATKWRGDLIIVAGKTYDDEFGGHTQQSLRGEKALRARYPQEALLAEAAGVLRQDPRSERAWQARGAALCVVRVADCHKASPGCCKSAWAEYSTGWPYHWVLADLRRLDPLLATRGLQGVYTPDVDLAEAVGAQLAA